MEANRLRLLEVLNKQRHEIAGKLRVLQLQIEQQIELLSEVEMRIAVLSPDTLTAPPLKT